MLLAIALFALGAVVVVQGRHSTAASVRNTAAPAYLDVMEAQAALSDSDRAVWHSLRSGEAQFSGPGQQYQDDITIADQELQQVAALEARGSAGSDLLQTLTGQLVTYQGLVEQADAADRADTALAPAGRHDLGSAYLGYAGQSLQGQGGLLPTITTLSELNRNGLNAKSRSLWTDPALLVAFVTLGLVMLAVILAFHLFLHGRFRRTISPPLLLVALLVGGLVAWMGAVVLPADSALTAARAKALPPVVKIWQDQTRAAVVQAHLLQVSAGGSASDAAGGLSFTAVQPASARFDADLASAQTTGGLLIGIPIGAALMAGLVFIAIKPRLDEYRG